MNTADRLAWTKEIKTRYPEKYYEAIGKKSENNPAGNYALLEKINKLQKEIQQLKCQALNTMTRIINLEMKK